jgi:hypothetical protein
VAALCRGSKIHDYSRFGIRPSWGYSIDPPTDTNPHALTCSDDRLYARADLPAAFGPGTYELADLMSRRLVGYSAYSK